MESRARRFSPLGNTSASAASELPLIMGLRMSKHSRSPLFSTWSTRTWLARLFGVLLVCGLALQLASWRASDTVGSSEQFDNGFADHLWRLDRDGADDDDEQPVERATTSVPLTASPRNALEYAAQRKQFDSAHHNADQRKVASMVQWAWKGYATYAYGHDSLNVKALEGVGLPMHDMALTLVDSLDTLYLVGMFDEFDRGSDWIARHMDDRIVLRGYVSVFETTIRLLGGLLSAYSLSGHAHLLEVADKLGHALSPAFTTYSHGVPAKDFDIVRKRARESPTLAEVGSLQLEFKYLARLTGNQQYFDQVERVMDSLARDVTETFTDGLLPVRVQRRDGRIYGGKITLGANGDSYYEYLLKQWLLSGKREDKYKQMYVTAVDGIMRRLVAKSKPSGLVFIGEIIGGEFEAKMDHLVCFVPGLLALGYLHGMPKAHLDLAEALIETCYQMYAQMDAKLAPEIVRFNTDDSASSDLDVQSRDAFNLLRPETVESLMVLYRVTKNETYRTYGRAIMHAFETHCKLPTGGYTSIDNVATGPPTKFYRDEMESFFIAETLKYLFLLFSDDSVWPLDAIVFNTEAHPFPIAASP